MTEKPWDINPDMTQERIGVIANLIAEVRGEVIDRHDEELGDTRLSLGIRAYECSRSRIITLAKQKEFPWLRIITPEGRFTFNIGNTPVRFTRNVPKYLPDRKMIRSTEAARQLRQLLLFEQHANTEITWFIVFDTFYKNPADNVYCVGYDQSKQIICQWDVPIEDSVPMMSDKGATLPQAVDVKEASVKLKAKRVLKKIK